MGLKAKCIKVLYGTGDSTLNSRKGGNVRNYWVDMLRIRCLVSVEGVEREVEISIDHFFREAFCRFNERKLLAIQNTMPAEVSLVRNLDFPARKRTTQFMVDRKDLNAWLGRIR